MHADIFIETILCHPTAVTRRYREMFFRKKKYDLAGVDRDSTVSSSSSSSDSNRMSYANSTSYGNSVGGGETLSRKKELRRLSAMSQIYDGSSARSSSSTLNRFSFVPPPDLTPPEATRKQRICPVFEQGTSVRRTSSDFTGTTHEKFPSNGCSVVKSSTDICSQTKPKVGVPEKVANVSNYISSNFQQRHSFDNQQQETTQNNNNNMNFQQPPIKSLPTPGPTNIDDVIHVVSQGLNSPHQTSTNHSPVHVTTPTEDSSGGSGGSSNDNNDSNSNNNNNNITISEEPSISQSNFSLSAPSNAGQMEIKSLRQLRRLAPKSVASSQLTTKEDFSRSTTTASTASASNAAATFTTNFSASEPVIDSITATNELELKSANKKKRSVITLSSISSSSSENPPAPSQPTSPETLPSSVDSTSPQPESVPLNEPRISYPDETDAITTSTTNTLFITEIVDHPVTVNVPSDFQEYVADGSMTTNIDEECQRDARNLQVTSGCYDNTETKDEGNIKATRIYVGSCFTNNEPTTCDVDDFLPGEVNSKVDSNVYLQNNCVSRIIIKNDTIAITNAEDRNKDRNNELPSSSTNVLTTSNQDSELVLLQTFDLEKVRTDVGGELERDGDICDPQSGTNVGESSVVEENDPHVDSNDVDPLLNDIDHDINVDTEVKGHQLSTSSSSPIIDDQPANQVKPKQPATIGKFQLNAGSNNFPTKPSNNHKSKSSRDGKDEEEEIDHDDDDDGGGDDGDHEYFKRKKQETIESRNGSFRGVRNLVKSGISTFANKEESQLMKVMISIIINIKINIMNALLISLHGKTWYNDPLPGAMCGKCPRSGLPS